MTVYGAGYCSCNIALVPECAMFCPATVDIIIVGRDCVSLCYLIYQRRYEMKMCLNKNAVLALLSSYILHSKFR